MPDVAALNVVISADTKDLEAGLARAEQSVSKAGSAIQSALGGALIAGIAGVGAAVAGSVKSAADFEKGLSAISAVSGATKEQLEGIRATALQLGKDTSFSASEAAAGMEEMVKAGVSLQDVMGGAGRAALDLAAAGGLSVAESATIASNAMNVFSLKGSDMAHVADVIAGAANASAIDVHDFGFSLSAVGAVAATVGLGLEDTATAIAVLGQAGLKGSDAGTSLKTMLLNLDPASKSARSAMKALGLITAEGANQFFTAEGKAKSLADISGILQNALKGLTKEQQLSALQTMFGTDAIRAAAIMAKAGSEGFNEMAESMSKVTAKAVAMERLNNVAGSFETLKGSLETAAIMLGSLFLPAIKGALDGITEFVNDAIGIIEQLPDAWRTAGEAFAGAWEPSETLSPFINMIGEAAIALREQFGPAIATAGAILQQLSGWFTENIAPIAAFTAGFLGAIGTVGLFTAAIAAVTAVLTLLLSPIGLVAIAVGLLAAAWTTNFMGIQEATAAAWAYLLPIFTQIVDWLGPKITAVLTWLAETGWPMMLAAAETVGNWITTVAIPAITELIDWLGPKLSAVVTWITDTGWPGLVAAATAVSDWITGTAVPAFTELVSWIGEKTNAVVTWLTSTGWPGLVTAGEKVWAVVQEIIRFFKELYVELDKREVFTTLAQLWDALVVAGGKVWEAIKKMDEIFRPFQALTAEFNSGPGKALVATFGLMGTSGAEAGKGIDIVAVAAKAMGTVFEIALFPVKNFLQALTDLGALIEKAKSWTLPSLNFGGGGGSGGSQLQSLSFGGGAKGAIDNSSREAFLKSAYPYALEAAMGDAKLAQQLLATAVSENGAVGTGKDLSTMGFNVGGIQGVQGTAGSFTAMDAGRPRQFAAYNNLSEGFAAVKDLISTGRYAPAYQQYQATGDIDQFWADLGRAGYAEDPNWAGNVGNIRRNQVEPVAVRVPNVGSGLGDIKISQAQWGASVGMTPAEAAAACGPYAASIFAQATGRMPDPAEAEKLARLAGWTEAGMGGTGNFMKLLGSMGVNAVRTGTSGMSAADITAMASNAGPLTGFSTPGHYFASTGFDPATQKFNVGATGTFAGGSTMMSVSEMAALMGPIQDIITLAGQMGPAFAGASAETQAAFQQMGVGATVAGQTMVSMSTDSMGNVTRIYSDASGAIGATITDAAGQIVNTWGTMATAVPAATATMAAGVTANTNLMATGALTSVTAMEAGILTTVQTSAGTTIATVTDMQGQVTAQYATLANGATLTMGDMAAGILTSTTDLGTGVMTTVQDMSGNYITTITDLSGNVTAQYTQLAADVTAQATAQTVAVTEQATEMRDRTLESVTAMGDGIITITTNAAGETVATITDMAGNVTSQVTSMGSDVVEQFGNVASEAKDAMGPIEDFGSALVDIPQADMSDTVKQFGEAAKAAKKAQEAIKKLADATEDLPGSFGGSKGGKSGFGKAAGGPIDAWDLHMVGEQGPELFMSDRAGTIIPNHMLGSGGSTQTVVFVVQQPDGRTLEEYYVTGKDLATRRGRA